MKLAEALALKGRLNSRMAELKSHMMATLSHEEGGEPLDSYDRVAAQYNEVAAELLDLEHRILRTNVSTEVAGRNGQTLSHALVDRADIGRRRAFVKAAADGARSAVGPAARRWNAREIRTVVAVDVATLDEEVARLDEEWTSLDAAIQATNWSTDLIE